MKKFLFELAGENLSLSSSEIRKLVDSSEVGFSREGSWVLAGELEYPRRLAKTHQVCRIIGTELEEVERPGSTYRVTVKGDKEQEKKIGEKLKTPGNEVDLESPDTHIRKVSFGDREYYTEVETEIARGKFRNRRNQERPYSAPVSMSPVLARVLVNLTGCEIGSKIVDPFCGTGGILIEAGLAGMKPIGCDINEEMVNGAKENLTNYGILNYEIKKGKASKTRFKDEPDYFVTDLPYGKSSKKSGDIESEMQDVISRYGKGVFVADTPNYLGHNHKHELRVHSSLTRYIYVVD